MQQLLIMAIGLLFSCAVFLILDGSVYRLLLGIALLGNAVNLLIFVAPSIVRFQSPILNASGVQSADVPDPLPQALVLTSIVISFGLVSFIASMAFRGFTQFKEKRHEWDPYKKEESK